MRLIDADALNYVRVRIAHEDGTIGGYNAVVPSSEIKNAPTIDAEPVRHGKWIIRDNPGTGWYRVTCSECGEDVTANAPCIGFFPNAKVTWDYCPNCGADMRGEQHG